MTDEQILDKIQKWLGTGNYDDADFRGNVVRLMKNRQPRGWKRIFKP